MCDVVLRAVRDNVAGFAVLWKIFKSGAFLCLWEKPPFLGNTAILVMRGNIAQTINIAFSERLTECSAIVWAV